MDIPRKPLDDMVREIIASLRAGEKGRPRYTLILGSGFSFPLVPTARQMVEGDIAWWRYHGEQKIEGAFCSKQDGIDRGLAKDGVVTTFERDMWGHIHGKASSNAKTIFPLASNGLPDLTDPRSLGLAYQALMADGLFNNQMRRQYLRDAIKRSGRRINGAHIFLASILEAQEEWDNGAPFCRTIFTTNFDPLLQRSLQLVNKLYFMSDRPAFLDAPDDDESDAIHLIYTHGSVHRYDLLNTEDQIARARKRNATNLTEYFQRRGVIVIGYSGWADTTMKALSACASFDLNLYWCDVHAAAEAEAKLRPDVVKLLKARGKKAFYVPISGAGEPMRLLHRHLGLNPVPRFILSPVETMIEQLKSIDVSSEPAATSEGAQTPSLGDSQPTKSATATHATSMSADLKTILDGTLTRLGAALSAFNDPKVVPSSGEEDEVAKPVVAKLLNDALVAYWDGKRDEAIRLWKTVIEMPAVPTKDRATALYSRGVVANESGDTPNAIADFSAVIDMPGAPADQRTHALVNRGIASGETGDINRAIKDFSVVIEMLDAPTEEKAKALYNRG
ncbi:MAG: hypothetical protein QOE82_3285, partial [Thermoanaerobaculia bacterium]|nr:hypothetical protein [Thermoanaerobaculia bacterium]